jgi:hypothetical protein
MGTNNLKATLYQRGLKLKFTRGPFSTQKKFSAGHSLLEKALRVAIHIKGPENEVKLIKFYNLVIS